jgi:hypothetical protein
MNVSLLLICRPKREKTEQKCVELKGMKKRESESEWESGKNSRCMFVPVGIL